MKRSRFLVFVLAINLSCNLFSCQRLNILILRSKVQSILIILVNRWVVCFFFVEEEWKKKKETSGSSCVYHLMKWSKKICKLAVESLLKISLDYISMKKSIRSHISQLDFGLVACVCLMVLIRKTKGGIHKHLIRKKNGRNIWQPNNVNKPSRHELNNIAIDTKIIHIWHALCTTSSLSLSPSSKCSCRFCVNMGSRITGPKNVSVFQMVVFIEWNKQQTRMKNWYSKHLFQLYLKQWRKLHTIIFRLLLLLLLIQCVAKIERRT